MLKVFDQNKNAKGSIVKYKDLCIESDLSTGDKSLSFVYFAKKAKDIRNEYYVETQDDRFVVKEVDVSSDGWPEYRCQLDLEDLESYMHERFSAINATLEDAARLAVAGTGWRIDTDITKVRSVATLKATPLAILGKIKDAWMCEIRYDTKNKIVYFRERFGEDRGVYFTRQLNLRKVDCKSDSYDFYTRIIPIGADGLRIEDVNGGKDYVENYQYSTKVRTLIWEDTSYEDAEALKEDAQAKLEDFSKPKKSYSADVIDLARQSTKYSILSYGLGDTVLLLDEPSGIRDRQRIVKLTEYPNDPGRNTCELSNTTLTFEEQQAKLEAAAAALEDISNADGTINGVYVHGVEADGIVGIETVINGSSAVQDLNAKVSTTSGNILQINGEIDAVKGRIGTLEVTALKATEADLKYATIEQLTATNAEVHRIQGDYADFKTTTTKELAAQTGIIDNLSGDFASYKTIVADNFTAANGRIDTLSGDFADYKEIVADNFTATNGQITNLSGEFSSFQTSMSQEMITAKGWMLEGAIGDAQISKVSANKIGAGTIDTAIVTVAGTDGRLQIQDNTIQIKDANRVRVQIGKDAGGDYSMSVWDASGQLIWDALGATENTIQRKIIRDRMVADDAAIQALKIDFQSFDTALTQQGVTISGTVVQVGNKTVNVALSEQTQLITEYGETLTDHATRITASENDIKLKVSSQDFNSYKTTVNSELTSAKNRLSTAESSITAMQGQIALKVEQTDIDSAVNGLQIGGRNLLTASSLRYTSMPQNANWSIYTVNSVGASGLTNDGYWYVPQTSVSTPNNSRGVRFKISELGLKIGDTISISVDIKGKFGTTNNGLVVMSANTSSTNFWANSKRLTSPHPVTIADWTRVGGTYTIPSNFDGEYLYVFFGGGYGGDNLKVYVRNIKIEKGTKATDWTPAPEDIDTSITAVDNKFANYSTTAQMQSAINLAKDSITSTVSKTYATQTYADGIKATADSAKKEVYASFSGNGDSKAYCLLCQIKTNQAYINTPTVIEINQRGYGYSLCEIKFASSNGTDPALYSIRKTGTPQWRIVKSATSTWDVYVKKSESWDGITVVGFAKGTVPSVTWICMNADLPSGSTAATQLAGLYTVDSTSGGTAGSDALITSGAAHSAISSVQTIATQTAEKFNWIVKSGTSATDFTLTDRTAQLITEKLTIKDSTGASTIISGGKMDINKIFAQDITATGTIRGVTLEGTKGKIGGWTISNQALYCGIGVSEFDENGAEINSVSYDTYIRAAEGENDKVFEVKTKRGQAASESVFYVTAKGGLHAENGTISIFNFSPYGFYADFTNDGVSDYRFAKDYFIATAYNASNVKRAYFYADSEMTTQSVNGRAIIFGNDTIDLRTNGAIRVMTETEQGTGVEHVVINPNGTITASGEVQGNIIRSANSVIGSNFVSGGSSYNNGYIELSGATPFIDFHFGNTSTDYTSRIIEWERNRLTITNGGNQTPLNILGCANGEGSIRYSNNTSSEYWVAGAGTGCALMSRFGFWYGPTSTFAAYIDNGGNFQAYGSIYSAGNMHAANGVTGSGNGGIYIGTGTIPFIYNAGNSGEVWLQTYVGGGWKWYSISQGMASVSSDKRLKDDVVDSTVNALPVVKSVKVRSFLRNDTKEYYKIGVVADELEEIDDLLTYGGGYTPDGHPIYKNVNVLQLSVYAVKAIQELDTKVEDTSRNAYSINSRVDGIDAQMNNLRNQLISAESTISNLHAEVAELRRMIHAA